MQLLIQTLKYHATINKTTYYKVADKNNPTFNANKTDKTVQDYKENVELARYTLKAGRMTTFYSIWRTSI